MFFNFSKIFYFILYTFKGMFSTFVSVRFHDAKEYAKEGVRAQTERGRA